MIYKLLNWNVNGLRARADELTALVATHGPHFVTIQESKSSQPLIELGYVNHVNSDSHHHGVMTLVHPDYESSINEFSIKNRYLEVEVKVPELVKPLVIGNLYLNQGQEIGSPEYVNKVNNIKALTDYLSNRNINSIIAGDFNICPTDNDVWSTDHWNETTLCCTTEERLLFKLLCDRANLRNVNSTEGRFTWYGYRHAWRLYDRTDTRISDFEKYCIKCDHILTDLNVPSQLTILTDHRLPVTKASSPTSDHVPMLFTFEC